MKALLPAAMILLISAGWAADVPRLIDDPTRPPEGMFAQDAAGVPSVLGLTSVFLPKKGRPAAIIDGQLVELGGSVRDAKLVRVAENHVVLRGPNGSERLYLTPDVDKKINVTKAAPRRQRE